MSGIINEDELMEKMKAKQDERINNLKAALVEKVKLAEAGNQKGTTSHFTTSPSTYIMAYHCYLHTE